MARQMASGLRITAQISDAPKISSTISVKVREFPALVSPMAGRAHGGGYQPFHPDDPDMVAELRKQSAQALLSWLGRYRGIAEKSGVDVTPIEEMAALLQGHMVGAA